MPRVILGGSLLFVFHVGFFIFRIVMHIYLFKNIFGYWFSDRVLRFSDRVLRKILIFFLRHLGCGSLYIFFVKICIVFLLLEIGRLELKLKYLPDHVYFVYQLIIILLLSVLCFSVTSKNCSLISIYFVILSCVLK